MDREELFESQSDLCNFLVMGLKTGIFQMSLSDFVSLNVLPEDHIQVFVQVGSEEAKEYRGGLLHLSSKKELLSILIYRMFKKLFPSDSGLAFNHQHLL